MPQAERLNILNLATNKFGQKVLARRSLSLRLTVLQKDKLSIAVSYISHQTASLSAQIAESRRIINPYPPTVLQRQYLNQVGTEAAIQMRPLLKPAGKDR